MMFGSAAQAPQGGEIDPALLDMLRQRFGSGADMGNVAVAPPSIAPGRMPAGSPGGNEGLPQAASGMFGAQRGPSIFVSGPQAVAPPAAAAPMPSAASGGLFGAPMLGDLTKANMRNSPAGLRATAGNEPDASNLPAVNMSTPGDAGSITDPRAASGQLGDVVNASMHIKKPGFFDKDGAWRPTLAAIGDAAMMLSAGQGNPAAMAFLQNEWATKRDNAQSQREQANRFALWQHDDQAAKAERQWKASQPQYFSGNEDRVAFDPVTGATKTLYDAPTDAQAYADSLGLGKGTPQYNKAMQDYVLKGNGPTAFGYDADLANLRFHNSSELKATPTYRDLNTPPPRAGGGGRRAGVSSLPRPPHTLAGVVAPMMDKLAKGQPLSPSEQTVYDSYMNRGRGSGRGRGGYGGAPSGGGSNIVINPQTGERKQWTGTAWVTIAK